MDIEQKKHLRSISFALLLLSLTAVVVAATFSDAGARAQIELRLISCLSGEIDRLKDEAKTSIFNSRFAPARPPINADDAFRAVEIITRDETFVAMYWNPLRSTSLYSLSSASNGDLGKIPLADVADDWSAINEFEFTWWEELIYINHASHYNRVSSTLTYTQRVDYLTGFDTSSVKRVTQTAVSNEILSAFKRHFYVSELDMLHLDKFVFLVPKENIPRIVALIQASDAYEQEAGNDCERTTCRSYSARSEENPTTRLIEEVPKLIEIYEWTPSEEKFKPKNLSDSWLAGSKCSAAPPLDGDLFQSCFHCSTNQQILLRQNCPWQMQSGF